MTRFCPDCGKQINDASGCTCKMGKQLKEWMPENPNPPADRLLTDDYLKNLFCDRCQYKSDCTGIEFKEYCKLIIKARQLREDQDSKSVKAVINAIQEQYALRHLTDCPFRTGNDCSFMKPSCKWWQQFKERVK